MGACGSSSKSKKGSKHEKSSVQSENAGFDASAENLNYQQLHQEPEQSVQFEEVIEKNEPIPELEVQQENKSEESLHSPPIVEQQHAMPNIIIDYDDEQLNEEQIKTPNQTQNFYISGFQVLKELNRIDTHSQQGSKKLKKKLFIDCDQANRENTQVYQ